MKHCRTDWDGIQDTRQGTGYALSGECSSIQEDEPVFLLRAKDPAAGATVFYWAQIVKEQGGDPELVARVIQWSNEMTRWKEEHYPNKLVADTPTEKLRDF